MIYGFFGATNQDEENARNNQSDQSEDIIGRYIDQLNQSKDISRLYIDQSNQSEISGRYIDQSNQPEETSDPVEGFCFERFRENPQFFKVFHK